MSEIYENDAINSDDDEDFQRDEALRAMLADLSDSDNASVNVYRQRAGTRKLAYLFWVAPGDYTYGQLMERIKSEYGSGEYMIHVRSDDKILKRATVFIEETKATDKKPADDSGGLKEILAMIADGQNKMLEALAQSRQQPAVDPLTMQTQMMNQMIQMKEFLGVGQAPAPAQSVDPMKMLSGFLEFQKNLDTVRDGANTNDVLVRLIDNVMPHLAELGKNEKASQTQTTALPAQTEAATPAPNLIQSSPLGQHINFLCSMADQKKDVAWCVDMILDHTPPAHLDRLYNFVSDPGCIESVKAQDARVGSNVEWFESLRTRLVHELSEDTEPGSGEQATQ